MNVEFLHFVACGAEIFARVEFSGLFSQDAAHGGGQGKAAVGVDIDFAYGTFCGPAKLLFGNTYCIGQFSAMGVDYINIFLRYAGGAVEHYGEAGEPFLDFVKYIKS